MNESNRTIPRAAAGVGFLALLVVLGWLAFRETPTRANGQTAMAVSSFEPPVTNAAVFYRQAFGLYDALSKEQKEIVSNWRANVEASVEAELCEKIRPICDRMHQAAALTNCDWGIAQPVTLDTRLPHLNKARAIVRASLWCATHCRRGDPAGEIDDLVASSRLGQNLSPVLIGHLVDLAIQNAVIEVVTEHAVTLARAGDRRLDGMFANARSEEGLHRAIEQEANMISNAAEKLAAIPRRELRRELEELAEENSELQSIDPAQAIAQIRQAADLAKQYAKMSGTSDGEYREWLARLESVRKANPFARLFLNPLDQVTERTRTVTVKRAMAAAGLAVIRDGKDALASHPDPAMGQPFVYTQTSDGFELESSFQFLGKPMKLRFK